jgi:hypothetical protein
MPDDRAAIQERYRATYDEFSGLLDHSVATADLQKGRKVRGDRDSYGEKIFIKLVCHGLSLRRLSPSPIPTAGELWDISSNYALARTLIETYEALAYVSIEEVPDSEREFRILLWKLHAQERRLEMLRLIGSNHPDIPQLETENMELRDAVLAHPHLPTTGQNLARKVQRKETPPYHLSRAERDVRSNINRDYHTVMIMHLSSHVHTHPFSVHQLFEFKAGDPDCLRLMGIAVQYSSAFLAKAVIGMRRLLAPNVPPLTSSLQKTLETLDALLAKGVNVAG